MQLDPDQVAPTNPVSFVTAIIHGTAHESRNEHEDHMLHRVGVEWNPHGRQLRFTSQTTTVTTTGRDPHVGQSVTFDTLQELHTHLQSPYRFWSGPFDRADDLRSAYLREDLRGMLGDEDERSVLELLERELDIYRVEQAAGTNPQVRDASTGRWGAPGERNDVKAVEGFDACADEVERFWLEDLGASDITRLGVQARLLGTDRTDPVVDHWRVRFADDYWHPRPWEITCVLRSWDDGEVRLDPVAGTVQRLAHANT